jgi:hypothetical protein
MKLLQWEFEFDKDDAKIVIPFLLLLLALILTPLNKVVLWSGALVYYALYFFLKPSISALRDLYLKFHFRCPHCKSRDVILQGIITIMGMCRTTGTCAITAERHRSISTLVVED